MLNDRLRIVEKAREDASFLSKATVAFPVGTDLALALSRWARLTVPYLADWCFIDLLMPDGMVRRSATAFRFPEGEILGQLLTTERAVESLPPAVQKLITEKHSHMEDLIRSEWAISEFSVIQPKGLLMTPMKIGGKSVGFITWLMTDLAREFTPDRVGVAEEFAGRIAMQLENLNAYRASQNALHYREEFISVASHELKTPLTVLKLQMQLLQQTLPTTGGAQISVQSLRKTLKSLDHATGRLSETVHRLLDLTEIRSGQLTLSCKMVDLREIVNEVATSLSLSLEQAGCELRLNLCDGIRGNWDRFRLVQVVTNLVANAAKYAPGTPVEVCLEKSEGYATLSVADHGQGIAQADQEWIFEQYARTKDALTANGLGLGLYICRNIVELHGGRIWVDSRLGAGAKFSIQLPIEM